MTRSPCLVLCLCLWWCCGGRPALGCYRFPAGVRDPCLDVECRFGSRCRPSPDGRSAECRCADRCATYGDSRGSRPVCGGDGRDYPNVCELERTACREARDIQVRYHGHCDPCEGVECPPPQVCQLDEHRNPICRCNALCGPDVRPVCGSDGKTYAHECALRVEACRARKKNLRVIYTGECSAGANPCEGLDCGPHQECDIDRYGIASCVCPAACEPVVRPVCGDDGHTYRSECDLHRKGCLQNRRVALAHGGECGERGPCHGHVCLHGSVCTVLGGGHAVCECAPPSSCPEEFDPVCGTDGLSHTNPCRMRQEACQRKEDVKVAHRGLCDGCETKKCEFYAVCESVEGEARCVCPRSCMKVESSVCGTDGVTYLNECEMRAAACDKRQYVVVGSRGPCDLCQNVHCKYGARCESGRCVCPVDCPEMREAVCASDGSTHHNECEMRREACRASRNLEVLFYGECEEEDSDSSTGGRGDGACRDVACGYGAKCDPMAGRCVCGHIQCPAVRSPVCGSDGAVHDSDCALRAESCRRQEPIRAVPMAKCGHRKEEKEEALEEEEDHHRKETEAPCDGEAPLVNPVDGREYECGRDYSVPLPTLSCPPSSYCHETFGKCCREVALIETCADSTFGCCPDDRTAALGPNNAGCPSVCNCNRLGSYGRTCDATSGQCACKRGVGGRRCDRCEPGYWGLHKASEGCTPCLCNLHGSVRDDCEQMTGRCVCRQGVGGAKCDACPPGTVLGPDGCMDVSISKAVTGSCADLRCRHGAVCRERDGLSQCTCASHCPPTHRAEGGGGGREDEENEREDSRTVCGTDGNTYVSECQMRLFGCRYQRPVEVASEGACKRGGGAGRRPPHRLKPLPTPGPSRRSTVQRVASPETKSTRDVGRPEEGDDRHPLTTRPTVASALERDRIRTPQFAGRSFLELSRLQAYTRLSLELEFRTFAEDGILLYNGQTETGDGDFVSLALRDGFVEFRYNLGNGPVVLRSPQKLHRGTFHRLIAKRYLRDGTLALEGQRDVAGRSRGSLKSLDLGENLFLGYVPTQRKGIFENVGVATGVVGCIRRLKIGDKEVDLRFPTSRDIIRGSDIHECGTHTDACAGMPCRNSATCEPLGVNEYACSCPAGFTGRRCETPEDDPCSDSPCSEGSTCVPQRRHGFACKCLPEKSGKLCEKSRRGGGVPASDDLDGADFLVPDFDGHSYLEFPTLPDVRRAFSIEVWFLTRSPDGTLLYNGGRRDFVAITLKDARVDLRYDLGSAVQSVQSPDAVTLNDWHSVRVSRLWKNGSLQVDDGPVRSEESPASLSELDLEQHSLYVGGVPDLSRVSPESGVSAGLDGAVQRIVVNGDVWERPLSRALWAHGVRRFRGPPCYDDKEDGVRCFNGGVCVPRLNAPLCRCPLRYGGARCEKRIAEEDLERPVAFDGSEFLSFSNKFVVFVPQRESRLEVRFRTSGERGLLLWTGGSGVGPDYLALAISGGRAQLSFNLGKQTEPLLITGRQRVDDSRWHTAIVDRNMRFASLTVDDHPPVSNTSEPGATELNTDGVCWIGGCPNLPTDLPADFYHGFRGCVESVMLDGDPMRLGHPAASFCDGPPRHSDVGEEEDGAGPTR